MNTLQKFEQDYAEQLASGKKMEEFNEGDTIRVNVRIVEGANERIQAFEGVCIAKKNAGLHSSFTVRKISHGEGVERVFPVYSPRVEGVEVVRKGKVRRAKLYYLRGLRGKASRISEKQDFSQKEKKEAKAAAKAEGKKAAKKPAAKEEAKTEEK